MEVTSPATFSQAVASTANACSVGSVCRQKLYNKLVAACVQPSSRVLESLFSNDRTRRGLTGRLSFVSESIREDSITVLSCSSSTNLSKATQTTSVPPVR
eukprot:GHVS01034009.1.p2 GENE.GHVS01034009.1~~GHVS01034009.1.p2  ORF type:complete len:100 (+),score=12.76 GHVS01034009.1:41-340(+)